MTATTVNLTIEQGATFVMSFTWAYDDNGVPGAPVDLTGTILRMQIRKGQGAPVLVEALNTGPNPMITHGGTNGHVDVRIPATSTDLLGGGRAVYDFEAAWPGGGDVYRVIEGQATVRPNITQTELIVR